MNGTALGSSLAVTGVWARRRAVLEVELWRTCECPFPAGQNQAQALQVTMSAGIRNGSRHIPSPLRPTAT